MVDLLTLGVEDRVSEVIGVDLQVLMKLSCRDLCEDVGEVVELRLRRSVDLLLALGEVTLRGDLHLNGAVVIQEGELGHEVLKHTRDLI